MDYKQRLNDLVLAEAAKNAAEEQRKQVYREQQREAFAEVSQPLIEVIEAAGQVISRKFLSETFANLEIAGPGSRITTYDIEPNSTGDFFAPSPAPGFCVKTETSYDSSLTYREPIKREYVVPNANALLEDLMKHIAEAIAKNL